MADPVAVTLVTGRHAGARERAIAADLHHFGASSDGQVAVILEGLADGAGTLVSASRLTVTRIAAGCLCCAGNLVLRVTLNRLLRQGPRRIYLGLARSDHLDQLRSWLQSAPYDQLLVLTPDLVTE